MAQKDDWEDDVYVFAQQADPDLVDELTKKKHPDLRYVALTTGGSQAFAVLEEPDLEKLPEALKRIFGNPGATGLTTSTIVRPGLMQIKRSKPYKQIAFVRIRVKAGKGEDVMKDIERVTGYNGSSFTAGNEDIIVEFGAENRRKLSAILEKELHLVPGIRWSKSMFVSKHFHRDHKMIADPNDPEKFAPHD